MNTKPKILFWINGFHLHFSIAYYLQSNLNADFFGIIDINSKPKKFFQNQTLVKFQKIWFFHDYIKKTQQKPDLEYLINFEKKYKIDLWKYALNERFFYIHNRFYKFTKEEILLIFEQELKLFESILDEIKPDYFLTFDPVFHHQKLLLELCRLKGIKVLSTILSIGIQNKSIIVENGATYDINLDSITNNSINTKNITDVNNISYDHTVKKYIKNRNVNFVNKFKGLTKYLLDFDSNDENLNFMYYGKTKFKVVKDAISLELKRNKNYRFLQKVSKSSPNLKNPYIYFPMSIDEEMNILHYAPYFTNQIEVIRHIAKSIPINYSLYVKEHTAAQLRGWHDSSYYKQLMDIPNVTFINPQFNNNKLLENSQLVITIRGSSSLKAMKYGKPVIIFGEQPIEIMPGAFSVDSIKDLPKLIKKALKYQVNTLDYSKYVESLGDRLFDFNMFEYEINRDKSFFAGKIFSNVPISNQTMIDFLNKNKQIFSNLINAHLKIISSNKSIK
jgi:hypothetical protein